MDLNPFFLAKTKCIIINFESIIMDFIISMKSHYNGFFFHFIFVSRSNYKMIPFKGGGS